MKYKMQPDEWSQQNNRFLIPQEIELFSFAIQVQQRVTVCRSVRCMRTDDKSLLWDPRLPGLEPVSGLDEQSSGALTRTRYHQEVLDGEGFLAQGITKMISSPGFEYKLY